MEQLTTRERFTRVLRFQQVDRLPVMEWAPWWEKTLERWRGQGMPARLSAAPMAFRSDRNSRLLWIGPACAILVQQPEGFG